MIFKTWNYFLKAYKNDYFYEFLIALILILLLIINYYNKLYVMKMMGTKKKWKTFEKHLKNTLVINQKNIQ